MRLFCTTNEYSTSLGRATYAMQRFRAGHCTRCVVSGSGNVYVYISLLQPNLVREGNMDETVPRNTVGSIRTDQTFLTNCSIQYILYIIQHSSPEKQTYHTDFSFVVVEAFCLLSCTDCQNLTDVTPFVIFGLYRLDCKRFN